MTQAPEKPQLNSLSLSARQETFPTAIAQSSSTNPPKSTNSLARWFYDSSIRTKILLVLLATQALTIASLVTVSKQQIVNIETPPLVTQTDPASQGNETNLEQLASEVVQSQGKTALVVVLVNLLITIGLANVIVNRIKLLQRAASDFTQGEYDARANISGQDEIGDLAGTFNQLADKIEMNESLRNLDNQQANLFQKITNARALDEDDVNQVINQTLQEGKDITDVDRLVIYRFNPDGSGYISHEASKPNLPSALKESINDPCIPLDIRKAYLNGRVIPTENVYQAGFSPDHEALMHRLEIKSNLVVPIVTQGILYGLLIAHYCEEYHQWTDKDITFLEEMSLRYGVILDRVNVIKTQISATLRAEQLKEVTTELANTLDRQKILDTTVDLVRQFIASDRAIIYEFDANWQGTITAESVVPQYPQALGAKIADPCFAQKYVERYEQGRVKATPDVYKAGLTDCHLGQLEPFAVKANLVAPVLVDGKLVALLICHQCSGSRYWQQDEIDLLTQISTQVGLALERFRLLQLQLSSEQEQREAREVLQRRALQLLMQVDPVSQGDLTIRATVTEDEIGTIADSYNATIENLRKIVSQVQTVAVQVSETTTSRQQDVTTLQTEIEGQVINIRDALDTVNMMNNSSKTVAQNAQQAESVLQQAQKSVTTGDDAMNRTVKSIIDIRATVQQATEQMKKLGETTENIQNVVGLISRFASQTHLLALKASIEAARAGEQGQGFAVIADEVRNLATQSAQATADIDKLVSDILAETKTVSMAMEEGNELVTQGSQLVEETRQSLTEITSATTQVNDLVTAIALAASEQSGNSEEVQTKMMDVAQVAQNTNLSVNRLSESFVQLQDLANQLESNVAQFKVS